MNSILILLKVIASLTLLPLVAVAAFIMTLVDICTPSNWETTANPR